VAVISYLEPALPVLLLLGLAGVVSAWRRTGYRHDLLAAAAGIVGIALLGSNWVAWAVSLPLEGAYRRSAIPGETDPTAQAAQAIVVLAGAADGPTPAQPYSSVSLDTYRRLRHGAWLFKTWQSLPILVCGGTFDSRQPTLAASMHEFLEADGIPTDLIWTETRSRSTRENALYGAEVLRAHGVTRVALVVEATGMWRAAAAFEKVGIHVVPAPIRFASLDGRLSDVVPGWRPMARNGEVVHELLGLLWYRLRGWI
jgi:uncharacterized SAM-binding protein YcdF (DUF218 family)